MSVDEFLDQVLRDPVDDKPPCLCSHPRPFHRYGSKATACIRACGCNRYRTEETG